MWLIDEWERIQHFKTGINESFPNFPAQCRQVVIKPDMHNGYTPIFVRLHEIPGTVQVPPDRSRLVCQGIPNHAKEFTLAILGDTTNIQKSYVRG